ncbi:hypothetical protein AMJ44_12460 [candidate division WOR-1 bacterium DG_54_3]|uniref:Uncharacterized protein n=1 Tax=candidate division WOR-1 bacterium DG_54_3 TaxID=1703775 RepID=A0A0S7XQ46_UNCSA|nr:MAG: hypothetical protein AMJ44_12460 [candidate division WOR-1 bacterium DG_54_3]
MPKLASLPNVKKVKFLEFTADKEVERQNIKNCLFLEKIMGISCYQNLSPIVPLKTKKANASVEGLQKAIELINKGRIEEAIRILKKLVSDKPKWVEAHRTLAVAFHKIGEIEAAIKEFEVVIELEPKNPENYFNLGMVYHSIEKNNLAISTLERAAQLETLGPKYKKHLSEIYYSRAFARYSSIEVSQESWREMISDLEKAIEFDPKNEDAHQLLAYIYDEIANEWRDQKDDTQARLYYELAGSEYLKVLELNPKSKVEFRLAKVCFNLGKYQLSHKYLSQYLKRSHDPEAQKLMQEIEVRLKEKK